MSQSPNPSAKKQLFNIGIIGGTNGLGAAFADAWRQAGHTVRVAGRNSKQTPQDTAKWAQILIIAVPIAQTSQVIQRLGPLMPANALLADMTSIKAQPVADMLAAFSGSVVGTHPLFGPSNLSPNARVALCEGRNVQANDPRISALFGQFQTEWLPAEQHDQIMATVQAANHLATLAFASAAANSGASLSQLHSFATPSCQRLLEAAQHMFEAQPRLFSAISYGTPQAANARAELLTATQQITQSPEAFEQAFVQARDFFLGSGGSLSCK